jgi:Na+-translocating ferredoxin:NAD+ oxidoreductase RnfA subunit
LVNGSAGRDPSLPLAVKLKKITEYVSQDSFHGRLRKSYDTGLHCAAGFAMKTVLLIGMRAQSENEKVPAVCYKGAAFPVMPISATAQ